MAGVQLFQRKKEDLERARAVQQLLLPRATPQLPGLDMAVFYRPAQELGGDFYDFLPYRDGRIAIAVGDIAGKGPAAALLASLGIGILREHAMHHVSNPAELLADLNRHLQIAGEGARFIAMAFGVYNPSNHQFLLANAGFPQPLLVRNRCVTPVEVTGVPLGLLADSAYESLCVQLEPGNGVVLCSDGIHEQTNALGEEFGLERLVSRLAETRACDTAGNIAADIVRALEEHSGETAACQECKDDRTIVVLRVADDAR